MKVFQSKNIEEQAVITKKWLSDIAQHTNANDEAVVTGLSGHLGAGKTAFVKAVAKELGVTEEVTSPTFVIMKIYGTKNATFKKLVHIDAYRLEKREELEALKFESIVSQPGNLVMIEWPENVGLKESDVNQLLTFEIADGKYKIFQKK